MREFVDEETKKRKQGIGQGLRKYSGIQATVKEMAGDVELRVWPCTKQFMTRPWTQHDTQWRPVINSLAQLIGQEVKCGVRVDWQASDLVSMPIPMARRPKSLEGIEGFRCWRKGEVEPSAQFIRSQTRLAMVQGVDLTFMSGV